MVGSIAQAEQLAGEFATAFDLAAQRNPPSYSPAVLKIAIQHVEVYLLLLSAFGGNLAAVRIKNRMAEAGRRVNDPGFLTVPASLVQSHEPGNPPAIQSHDFQQLQITCETGERYAAESSAAVGKAIRTALSSNLGDAHLVELSREIQSLALQLSQGDAELRTLLEELCSPAK